MIGGDPAALISRCHIRASAPQFLGTGHKAESWGEKKI